MVLSLSSLPAAEPVGVTRNSMPAAFDNDGVCFEDVPVAGVLTRIPARVLPDDVVLHAVVDASEDLEFLSPARSRLLVTA